MTARTATVDVAPVEHERVHAAVSAIVTAHPVVCLGLAAWQVWGRALHWHDFFGRRRFATGDESRNLAWLAPFSLGEAWHNNHHAFPTSAAHGLRWWEVDLSAWVIRGLERLGLASDVVRVEPQRQRTKAVAPAS